MSGITSNYSGENNQKEYEGQQIEFDGFYFNIPDGYTSLDDIGSFDEGDSEEHVKVWVYGSDIGCMIALMSGVEADTNADEFKTNAREIADDFSNGMVKSKSADIDYRDTSVGGMWALEANCAGLPGLSGTFSFFDWYRQIILLPESVKNLHHKIVENVKNQCCKIVENVKSKRL